ncbi:Non-specific serine/threonine protein kinase [Bertholletia excelsa]
MWSQGESTRTGCPTHLPSESQKFNQEAGEEGKGGGGESVNNEKQQFQPMAFFFLLFFFMKFVSPSLSDPRISEAALLCGNSTPTGNTSYIPPFVKEMEVLSEKVTADGWGIYAVNSSTPIYGLAQCYEDLSHTDCLLCYAVSRTRIPHCLPYTSARLYLDGFFSSTDPVHDLANCSSDTVDLAKDAVFKRRVEQLIENVTEAASLGGGFAVREVQGLFGLAQCWKSLSTAGCKECLEKAAKEVRGCVPSRDAKGLNAGCYLRYSTQGAGNFFFSASLNSSFSELCSGDSATGVIVAIALAATAFLMFSFFAGYACYGRFQRIKKERNNVGQFAISFHKCRLNFKYEALEKATNYFDTSRKIGQGGAGSVFVGTLPDGEAVAVKRLFFNTRQWVDEFFNEVNLISGIQHKNLVKLLGCSIEGPESLLVHEYVPNKSLDQFLLDKVQGLNWKQRRDIIVGTAEGLAYLHSGTETRIIHRDIKSSNILLDENPAPKIADFGLARCFGADKTHLSTGIAGTLGYMAPEYLARGQLTEKADVYSYGALVLEIFGGRKNNACVEDSCSLIQTVWKLYNSNRLVDSVDPRLKEDFPAEEALQVLQVGLLCIQASAALRPSMDEVVQLLGQRDCEIPVPNQPAFLSTATRLNRLISSAFAKIEAS